jgi:hypothetical protein
VGSETKPLMPPLPAWAKAAVPAQKIRIHIQRKVRIEEEPALLFFMAAPGQTSLLKRLNY